MQINYLASWTVTGQYHAPYVKKNFHTQKEAIHGHPQSECVVVSANM